MKIRESEVTDESLYMNRRQWLKTAAASVLAASLPTGLGARQASANREDAGGTVPRALNGVRSAAAPYLLEDRLSSEKDATSYNNFYEFGSGKRDPAANAKDFVSDPWSVVIDGEVAKPGTVPLETLLAPHDLEERIYRLRCVEAWSMIVPWIGIPLADVLKRFKPTSKARYVVFETLYDPDRMSGQKRATLNWPYREGLRIDEATHPLVLLAVGMYGKTLPNQNGAPLRLVVPWKYGFKSIKSIVRISLTAKQPSTTWNDQAADEYGFFANVNPDVDHPRWSQARERRLGEFRKRPTLPFNGYASDVSSLYRGMDLRQNF